MKEISYLMFCIFITCDFVRWRTELVFLIGWVILLQCTCTCQHFKLISCNIMLLINNKLFLCVLVNQVFLNYLKPKVKGN